MPRPLIIPAYPSRAWVIWTCFWAFPACFYIIMKAVTIWLYGVEVLWNGIPEAIDRGPGDGLVVLFALPAAFLLWVIAVAYITSFVRRRRSWAIESGHHTNAA